MILESVRAPLLEEARRSPHLLSDLAGLEQYIAESYDSRSFAELLQNADDAGAVRFLIQRSGSYLLVANNGRAFTQSDFESLCRSAASNKERGTSIGYRGIGFKSVVGLARTVYLFSGELAATFSRDRTAREIPQAQRVPLVRIPHPVEDHERAPFVSGLTRVLGEGYSTVFVFGDLIASGIESEFASFDPTSLLFLRHLRQLELRTTTEEVVTVRRETVDQATQRVRLTTSDGARWWTIITKDDVSLAFAHDELGPSRLEEQDAVVHAFLPSREPTGLAIKVNGDFSTDPSRTRVLIDERTRMGIDRIAKLVFEIVIAGLVTSETPSPSSALLKALIPQTDPRALAFQRRSFKTELLAAIKREAQDKIKDLRCRPDWLNAVDFEQIALSSGLKIVPRHLEEISGLTEFLRYLGSAQAGLDELSAGMKTLAPSLSGCAEIVAHLVALFSTKQIAISFVQPEWRIWPVANSIVSLRKASSPAKPLNPRFVELVVQRVASRQELTRFMEALTDTDVTSALIPEVEDLVDTESEPTNHLMRSEEMELTGSKRKPITLKRWRSAEEQVLSLLAARGWQVNDVSRQNLGYDIEGQAPNEKKGFFEVKSIDYPGQAFMLTSNEEAVAREKGTAYYIALVRQNKDAVEVAFIRDPVSRMRFTRQCRQWVWECSEYDFQPEIFDFQ